MALIVERIQVCLAEAPAISRPWPAKLPLQPSSSQKVAKRILQSVPSLQLHSAAAGLDGDSTMARERLLGRCLAFVRVRVGAPEKWVRCTLDCLPGSGEVGQARPREDQRREIETRRPGVGNCWSFVKGQNFRRRTCQICQSYPLPTQAT